MAKKVQSRQLPVDKKEKRLENKDKWEVFRISSCLILCLVLPPPCPCVVFSFCAWSHPLICPSGVSVLSMCLSLPNVSATPCVRIHVLEVGRE